MPKKVIVIGAGLGGLAAAIRLACTGHKVELWEKNNGPGGKLKERRHDGFRWDAGPSLLTMPQVLRDLFTDAAADLDDYLTLRRLDSCCRYFWSDGTMIDEDAEFWKRPEVVRFLNYARGIYQLSGETFLNYPPAQFWRAFAPRNWPRLRHLPKIATTQTLAQKVDHYFSDPHLRQFFYRFATYNGSSPWKTPAAFNIIPCAEADFGGWYVEGGLYQIAIALEKLANRSGVKIRYNTTAAGYRNGTLAAMDGRVAWIDYLVCNADCLQSRQTFLSEIDSHERNRQFLDEPLSSSGLILFLGVKRRYEQLRHHNIFFSDDYPGEFADIFEKSVLPGQPTIYISITARANEDHAPHGQDNFFVLVNAPARRPGKPWTDDEIRAARDRVIDRLEKMGLENLRHEIATEKIFTPADFALRDLAYAGSLYGWASHSVRTALFRPPMRSRRDRRVFFVGGTTHPGGGIPLALLSGKMAAAQIEIES